MSRLTGARNRGTRRDELPVASVARISREEFSSRYLLPRQPVVLTDAISGWPALRKWTWEWLSATHGHHDVLVADPQRQRRSVRFADYLRYVVDPSRFNVPDGPLYLSDLGLHELPVLFDDYSRPSFVEDWFARFPDGSRPPFRWLFIGPVGTGSALHTDTSGTHAWLAQIQGEKEWRLYPPDELPLEYCGRADAFAPDLERFPALGRARFFSAVLRRGEVLFVPCGWRHQVRNLGPSWAITENFCNASNLEDVYRDTEEPRIRSILEDLCLAKTREPRRSRPGIAPRIESRLLHDFLSAREGELQERLTALRAAKERLSPPRTARRGHPQKEARVE